MPPPSLRHWALLLLLLPSTGLAQINLSSAQVANDATDPSAKEDLAPCNVQAWVRAQDLVPGEIVHGDVKVKVIGECDVEAVSLGLRFKERSAVKFARPGVEIPTPPAKQTLCNRNRSSYNDIANDILAVPADPFRWMNTVNNTVWDDYQDAMRNKSLWITKEQERIAFDAQQPLNVDSDRYQTSFAILVPNTNYPPVYGQGYGVSPMNPKGEYSGTNAESEFMHEYYVRVTFKNGSTRDIHCGYTVFLPSSTFPLPSSSLTRGPVNVTLSPSGRSATNSNISIDLHLWLVADSQGPAVFQGVSYEAEVSAFSSNESLRGILRDVGASVKADHTLKWATSFAADRLNGAVLKTNRGMINQLTAPTAAAEYDRQSTRGWGRYFKSYETDELPVRTPATSFASIGDAKTVHVEVEEDLMPTFELFYSDLATELTISATFVPEALLSEPLSADEQERDEWVPEDVLPKNKQRHWTSDEAVRLTGSIPIRILTPQTSRGEPSIHYLAEGARAPIFVDVATIDDLQRLSVEQRDAYAPLSVPRYVDVDEDDIKLLRYNSLRSNGQRSIYVGATWQRKVINRGVDPRISPVPKQGEFESHPLRDPETLVVQAL